jgi:biotin synthase
MCYAIPGKVIELKNGIAVLNYFGEERRVLNEFGHIQVGDYVYAQGGVLINRISQEEGIKTLRFWKKKFFELKEVDEKLSEISELGASDNILEILQKVNLGMELTKKDVLKLLDAEDGDELKLICETANNLRKKENDNACCVHGIIEFSNYCKNNCHYCGIRKDRDIQRYRMSPEEIVEVAKHAVNDFGFKALVLQSGEDFWYDEEKLIWIVQEVRKLDVLIFLSIGVRSKETYDKLYESGARAVLLRFETSNKKLFEDMRPGTSFDDRIKLLKWLKDRGYIVATGFLVGLPGETREDIVNNIFLTKELGADMYSHGPLIPAEQTPFENEKLIDESLMLKVIALSRLVDRDSKILVTTALETLNMDAKKRGLLSGANSLMINVTPKQYRERYTLYPGRPDKDKEIMGNIEETLELLYSIGRAPTDLGL